MRRTDLLAHQVARYRELDEALSRAETSSERAQLGVAVADLYQQVAVAGKQIAELQEGLQRLVDRYGLRSEGSPVASPGVAPAPPASGDSELDDYIRKGWNCIQEGDYDGAKEVLKEALALAPDDPDALSSLAWVQTVSRDYGGALLTYQHLLTVKPDDALARVNLGYICLEKGIYGEAIEHLSSAARTESDPRAALYGHYYLGLVYLAREMYNDAETFFERTVALSPTMSGAYFQLGRTRYLLGRKADAISAWKEGAGTDQFDFWASRCGEAVRAAESGRQPLLD